MMVLGYSFGLLFQLTGDALADMYKSFVADYPVVSIEDAFDQDDWVNWTKFKQDTTVQLVGYSIDI